jgi:glycine hydroxymethyltransferase
MDEIFDLIDQEGRRQFTGIQLIPSENIVSGEVLEAVGSCLTNKYSEGYVGKRYYQGNRFVDEIEQLAIDRAKELFGFEAVNVQAYSGSPANSAILFALLERGDKICGLKLSAGGHLTHGHPKITFSGKYFDSVQYDVEKDGRIDYKKLEELVKKEKPNLIFAGTTAYPFELDFEKFGKIADSVGAWLVADISHIAGLVVTGEHMSPVDYVDVVMTTTHKTLRGPRGAIIGITKKGLKRDKDLAKKINKAVFPGLQGGPHVNNIAGIAVALGEAMTMGYIDYIRQVKLNAKVLADTLRDKGYSVFGTENHLMVVDVGKEKGKEAAVALEDEGIYCNANTIPHDEGSPLKPSGIRLGSPCETTKGKKAKEFIWIAEKIDKVLRGLK